MRYRPENLSLQQPERFGFDNSFLDPHLGVDRAVALAGVLGQIELAFEADRAAVATAVIGLLHSSSRKIHSSEALLLHKGPASIEGAYRCFAFYLQKATL